MDGLASCVWSHAASKDFDRSRVQLPFQDAPDAWPPLLRHRSPAAAAQRQCRHSSPLAENCCASACRAHQTAPPGCEVEQFRVMAGCEAIGGPCRGAMGPNRANSACMCGGAAHHRPVGVDLLALGDTLVAGRRGDEVGRQGLSKAMVTQDVEDDDSVPNCLRTCEPVNHGRNG